MKEIYIAALRIHNNPIKDGVLNMRWYLRTGNVCKDPTKNIDIIYILLGFPMFNKGIPFNDILYVFRYVSCKWFVQKCYILIEIPLGLFPSVKLTIKRGSAQIISCQRIGLVYTDPCMRNQGHYLSQFRWNVNKKATRFIPENDWKCFLQIDSYFVSALTRCLQTDNI